MSYICEYCNYETKKKANLLIHFKTNKHKRNIQNMNNSDEIKRIKNAEEVNKFACSECGKIYKHSQSLYNHKKYPCNENDKLNKLKLEKLEEKVRNMEEQHKKETKKLKEMINDKCNNTTIINNNSNNNTTNNVTVNLLAYNNSDISHLTREDYINTIQKTTAEAMIQLLKLINLNSEKKENMNVLLTDVQNKLIEVYDGSKWVKVNK